MPAGSWFAVQVRSQCEKSVTSVLSHKGYETFLPLYKSQRQWSDRIKEIESPLFPGYIFCRMFLNDPDFRVVTTSGVVGIVGVGKKPIAIEQNEIEALQSVIAHRLRVAPCSFFHEGARVKIEGGPLMGVEGTLVRIKNSQRLVLSVTLLRRSVSVEVDSLLVVPVREPCVLQPEQTVSNPVAMAMAARAGTR